MGTDAKPAEIARMGLAKARAEDFDAIIVDTAGRLQVLMSPNHALVAICSVAHCITHLIILQSYRRPPSVSHSLPI
jgi:signal recognition particle GTPase